MPRRILRLALTVLAALAAFSVLWVLAYRVVPVPATPLMLVRAVQGHGLDKDWTALDRISPNLARAVIAAEDTKFCGHYGFDLEAIEDALQDNAEGGSMRGGSTISQQTAKNAFLWPDRSWLRKGVEAGFTLLVETLWPKARIVEVYLNIVEWGPGLYGAEAAARRYFDRPASGLTERQAALMAAVLPNPLRWSPARPTDYIQRRATVIQRRMAIVARDGLADCAG
ncbi:monofunctional biosynthetic peptidoglycan transglycosylase [Arenibaculum pallidiluteum]|uniref:monofunctional biosynthetic peptidoglycan transglycosylase n=1 Tax=Arenibaculum pallidiluteum TaxID=2812559 RepID=UPI001A96CDF9|nr:monofunctional biosynthetic peptidoglycan transglycosylase [Arenibaculum pallidiluteum]